jgi:hypothetical protein
MTFADAPWGARFDTMGDPAEDLFKEVAPQYGLKIARYGLARPPMQVHTLPMRIRYTPDFLTNKGLVECQGFGREQKIKLKREKLDCLSYWNTLWPVSLFLNDSHKKRHSLTPLEVFMKAIDAGHASLQFFKEGKAFFEFPASLITEWTAS